MRNGIKSYEINICILTTLTIALCFLSVFFRVYVVYWKYVTEPVEKACKDEAPQKNREFRKELFRQKDDWMGLKQESF